MTSDVWIVLLAALTTAVATGIGVFPSLWIKDAKAWWNGLFSAIAGGLMAGASHSLLAEGWDLSPARTLGGAAIGLGMIVLANRRLHQSRSLSIADLHQANARRALVILGVMTAHSFAEGIGVGVSFGGRNELGVFITSAIALHNIPEGLAICLILVPRGTPAWKAALWSIFTSLPQPLMAVPAFLFVQMFKPILPIGFGLAAGAMIWMVFAELIPEALENTSKSATGSAATLAFIALLAFQHFVMAL